METKNTNKGKPEESAGKIPLQRLVMPSVDTINDALWWVKDGLASAAGLFRRSRLMQLLSGVARRENDNSG